MKKENNKNKEKLKREKLGLIEKLRGTAKGSKPFKRDRTDRIDRY